MALPLLDLKQEWNSQLSGCAEGYFVVWRTNITKIMFLPLWLDFAEVTYQVTFYLRSAFYIQKQTTKLNATLLVRQDLFLQNQGTCINTCVYNIVYIFAKSVFLPMKS